MKDTDKLTYEQAFARLEEIAQAMNKADAPLDKLIALYEEGMELAAHCEKLLKGYEARLEKVSKNALARAAEEADALIDEDPLSDEEEAPF